MKSLYKNILTIIFLILSLILMIILIKDSNKYSNNSDVINQTKLKFVSTVKLL